MTKKPKNSKKSTAKRGNEILFTLTGEVGDWLMKQAKDRGLLNRRGGIQSLIYEKLFQQKQLETA